MASMKAIPIIGIGIITFILIRILAEVVSNVNVDLLGNICILKNGFGCEFKNVNCEFGFYDYGVLSPTIPIYLLLRYWNIYLVLVRIEIKLLMK